MEYDIVRLGSTDSGAINEILDFFALEFHDTESYLSRRPSQQYIERLFGSSFFICLVARFGGRIIGCLIAYELVKFEQERSEIYIYDLAVSARFRRQGIATGLIRRLKEIARTVGAWVIFVQADTNEEDRPALGLYSKLGKREDVVHFDIAVD